MVFDMTVVKADILRAIHRIHHQLADLNSRLQRGPRQLQANDASVAKLKEAVDTAKEAVKRNRILTDQKELQLKEREGRILDVRAKLNGASSNREYQAFLEQIAADEEANSVLSDEILELFDKATELTAKVEDAQGGLQKGEKDLDALRKKIEGERASLEQDVLRLQGELAELEKQLPTELKVDYQRIVKVRGAEGLAQLDGDTCGSCFTIITTQMQSQIMLEQLVFCKSCGCILYKAESEAS